MNSKKELKEKLDKKVEQEYEEFIEKLRKKTPDEIIESSYEKVTKEELVYKIQNRDYETNELKALLKQEDILAEFYDEWMDSDLNYNELLEEIIEDRVNKITEDFKEKLKEKKQESR